MSAKQDVKVPHGFCHCGCGRRVPRHRSDPQGGYHYKQGDPHYYLPGHWPRRFKPQRHRQLAAEYVVSVVLDGGAYDASVRLADDASPVAHGRGATIPAAVVAAVAQARLGHVDGAQSA